MAPEREMKEGGVLVHLDAVAPHSAKVGPTFARRYARPYDRVLIQSLTALTSKPSAPSPWTLLKGVEVGTRSGIAKRL
jgi:hypothetical protein